MNSTPYFRAVACLSTLLITACASRSDINEGKEQIREVSINQQSIHGDLKKLHAELEAEFSRLRSRLSEVEAQVSEIREKTDQFKVQRSSNSLLFVPSE